MRLIGVSTDITERKRAEEHQRLLLLELSHRVKNTLAVVQSLAARSLTGERTLEQAREDLSNRLRALANAHSLLTASEWREAGLRAVVEAELKPYGRRATLAGPDLALLPKAALTLALVVHELAANAAKHGALAGGDGRLEVGWEVARPHGRRPTALRLTWRERDGPPVQAPLRRGFGRTLIEQGLKHDLGGEVAMEFRPDGLRCVLTIPASAALADAISQPAHPPLAAPPDRGRRPRSRA